MRLKVGLAGCMEIENFELCVKNQFIWKNKQNDLCFLKNIHFYWCSWAALDPLAGRLFETPKVDYILSLISNINIRIVHKWSQYSIIENYDSTKYVLIFSIIFVLPIWRSIQTSCVIADSLMNDVLSWDKPLSELHLFWNSLGQYFETGSKFTKLLLNIFRNCGP